MYIENKQMTIFSNPAHFMGAKLDPENRWIKISQMIPWDEIEAKYKENFSKEMGRPAKPVRMAVATCVPSDIRFPTDVSLLSEAREKSEQLIDALHERSEQGVKKPRTYRRKARKDYLRFARNRKPKKADIRKAIRKQLSYLGRNLKTIAVMGEEHLSAKQGELLKTLKTLYAQQKDMYEKGTHTVADRVVSIHSPFVRPIVRGKTNAPVEFGAKVAISIVDGFAIVEHLSWDAFNEMTTLIDSIERAPN